MLIQNYLTGEKVRLQLGETGSIIINETLHETGYNHIGEVETKLITIVP